MTIRKNSNHGYGPQSKLWKQFRSKLRGIISLFIKDNSTNASYRQRVSLPSAVRDCSTYKFQFTSFMKFESHNNSYFRYAYLMYLLFA